jgi:Phage Tail Protein X
MDREEIELSKQRTETKRRLQGTPLPTTYVTQKKDMWDLISWYFYDSEFHMTRLMEANPEYMSVAIFDEGVTLKIPALKEPDRNAPRTGGK